MRALILNSGLGKRMGDLTSEHPKCMTRISGKETILSRQLQMLQQCGIANVVMTTGLFDRTLVDYCTSLNFDFKYTFVNNPLYDKTNYIYSIYLATDYLHDDIILLHGDLVFELEVLQGVLQAGYSCMTVSSTIPLPPKDFKAVIKNGKVDKIGVEFFDNAIAAQPLYKLNQRDWIVWLDRIKKFCDTNQVSCYAENAFNEISDKCHIYPVDFADKLCCEIDTPEDLLYVRHKIARGYMA